MKELRQLPPKIFLQIFRWYCNSRLVDHIEGDLIEVYKRRLNLNGKARADLKFILDVLLLFRPGIVRPFKSHYRNLNSYGMFKSYFKMGWRNLLKNKGYSFINVGGLATGMAVAILIGLWIVDELSFNKSFNNYDRIAKVWQFVKFDVEKSSYDVVPIPLADDLRDNYTDFETVTMSCSRNATLSTGDNAVIKLGNFVDPSFISLTSLNIVSGSKTGLDEINSIMLSESLSKNLFGSDDPLNKLVTINNDQALKITGVFEDFAENTSFKDIGFLIPWNFLLVNDDDVRSQKDEWDSNSYSIYVLLKDGSKVAEVSTKIKDARIKRANPPAYKPEFFLHPMTKWHLYSDFKDGKNTGGLIVYVWLFGTIGFFVLVLACINFMNLATARSERRAREVGIRKSIGSVRGQLIIQFLTESLVIVALSFLLSLVLVQLALPTFNEVVNKNIVILWTNPWFWLAGLSFCLISGLLAGSYPAFYLSSFLPVKVLKGTFRAGRFAALPRKALVVLQFTVSITLIMGIAVIFRQLEFAKSRSVGYEQARLIEVSMNTPQIFQHVDALQNDLLKSGAIEQMSQSSGSITLQYDGTTDFSWEGKNPETRPLLMRNKVTYEYGRTIGWQLIEGRDFSREYSTDSSAMIINEAAVRLMGFKKPLNETVNSGGKKYNIIGIIRDMVRESPFEPVKPTFFIIAPGVNTLNIRLSSQMSVSDALTQVEEIFKKHNPSVPFDYDFVDTKYARKFSDEERIGKLSAFFALLATFISTLGILGLASFTAEQRRKEIGIKKVLGATVFQLWQMLSKDFLLLVIIAFVISTPVAYYFMTNWLMRFEYRTELAWWIFAAAGFGALIITLITVSYQSVKAALANPVKSLRSE